MDISSIPSQTLIQGARDEIGISVLKKAMDVQAQSAMALINAIPPVQSAANLPPNLGQNINVTA
jgi:hypothetical protein